VESFACRRANVNGGWVGEAAVSAASEGLGRVYRLK